MRSKYRRAYKKLRKLCQSNFPRYKQILTYLDLLAILYRRYVQVEKIGESIEGRPIHMIILQNNPKQPKNAVMIEGGIHAREWLSHTTILYIIDNILQTKTMLKYMDFYIIPCLNPDGYEFSHTSCRLWRKNMNRNNSKEMKCWGVDLNRNFPVAYGCDGSSAKPKSDRYHGTHSLSEPETQSLADAVHRYAPYIKLYLSIHCFGPLIMYPWAHTMSAPADVEDLLNCATEAQKAMKCKFPDSEFEVGQCSRAMYISSGTTVDYVRKEHKIKFAFIMELHTGGRSGFEPRRSQIVCSAQETLVGIETMVKHVYKYYSRQCCKRKTSSSCIISSKRFCPNQP